MINQGTPPPVVQNVQELSQFLSGLSNTLSGFSGDLQTAQRNIANASKAIKNASALTASYNSNLKMATAAQRSQHESIQKLAVGYNLLGHGQSVDLLNKKQLIQLSRAVRAVSEQEAKALKKISGEYLTLGGIVAKFSKTSLAGIKSFAVGFGIAIPTVSELTKKLIEYRSVQFSVSRTQQVFGKGMDDLSKSMEYVKKNTILSKQQFMSLVDSFQKGYIGAAKSSMEIAKIGATLQKAFGPNIDEITKRSNDLLGIMNKFPALGKIINKAGELAQFGGDPKKIQQYQTQIVAIGRAIGLSAQEWDTVAKMTTKATEEQRKQQQMAEKIAKAQQYFADILVDVAEQMDKIVIGMSKWIKKNKPLVDTAKELAKLFAKYPVLIMATVAAVTKLNLISKASSFLRGIGDNKALRRQRGIMGLGGGLMGGGGGLMGGGGPGIGGPGMGGGPTGASNDPFSVIPVAPLGQPGTTPPIPGGGQGSGGQGQNPTAPGSGGYGKDIAKSLARMAVPLAAIAGGLYIMGLGEKRREKTGGDTKSDAMSIGGGILAGAGAGYMMGGAPGAAIGAGAGLVVSVLKIYTKNTELVSESMDALLKGDARVRQRLDYGGKRYERGVGTDPKKVNEAKKELARMDAKIAEMKKGKIAPTELGFDNIYYNMVKRATDPKNIERMTEEFKKFKAATESTPGLFLMQKQFAEMQQNLETIVGLLGQVGANSNSALASMSSMGIVDPQQVKDLTDSARKAAEKQLEEIDNFQKEYLSKNGVLAKTMDMKDITAKLGKPEDFFDTATRNDIIKIGPQLQNLLLDSLEKKKISASEFSDRLATSIGMDSSVKNKLEAEFSSLGDNISAAAVMKKMQLAEESVLKETTNTAWNNNRMTREDVESDVAKAEDLKTKIRTTEITDADDKKEVDEAKQQLDILISKHKDLFDAKEKLAALKDIGESLFGEDFKNIGQAVDASKVMLQARKAQEDVQKADLAAATATMDVQMQYNNVLEQRLNMERELMEAAQFGMGASIDMMQKQVALQQKIIQQNQTAINGYDEQVAAILRAEGVDEKRVKSGVESLKTATDFNETKQIMLDLDIKDDAVQGRVAKLTMQRTKYLTDQMQAQKKIYDITKEMREGYLDAIKEMAWGAGEFEKIIGTQEMGVTQLMKAVDSFSADGVQGKLNTFKLGGQQSRDMTAAGVGTNYAGSYTVAGATFETGAMAEQKNRRIWNYGKSMNDYMGMARGESVSEVGTGVGGEATVDAINDLKESNFNTTRDAFVAAHRILRNELPGNRASVGGNINTRAVTGAGETSGAFSPGGVTNFATERARAARPAVQAKGFAPGGPVNAKTWAMLGEFGTEYVVSHKLMKHPIAKQFLSVMEDIRKGKQVEYDQFHLETREKFAEIAARGQEDIEGQNNIQAAIDAKYAEKARTELGKKIALIEASTPNNKDLPSMRVKYAESDPKMIENRKKFQQTKNDIRKSFAPHFKASSKNPEDRTLEKEVASFIATGKVPNEIPKEEGERLKKLVFGSEDSSQKDTTKIPIKDKVNSMFTDILFKDIPSGAKKTAVDTGTSFLDFLGKGGQEAAWRTAGRGGMPLSPERSSKSANPTANPTAKEQKKEAKNMKWADLIPPKIKEAWKDAASLSEAGKQVEWEIDPSTYDYGLKQEGKKKNNQDAIDAQAIRNEFGSKKLSPDEIKRKATQAAMTKAPWERLSDQESARQQRLIEGASKLDYQNNNAAVEVAKITAAKDKKTSAAEARGVAGTPVDTQALTNAKNAAVASGVGSSGIGSENSEGGFSGGNLVITLKLDPLIVAEWEEMKGVTINTIKGSSSKNQ